MNQRIRLLAELADPGYTGNNEDGLGASLVGNDAIEKFAELIVKECLEACSRANEIRHFVPPTQEQVILNCLFMIKTTFRS